jgi:hypothetical protein
VTRTDTGWETLGGAMPGVSFGYATVLHDQTITTFTGRTEDGLGGSPITYVVNLGRVRTRPMPQTWLGAALDRRPGVTVLGRVILFGGNATDGVGPGGVAIVEEIEARCFNGVVDRRERSITELGDSGDGCPVVGSAHQTGTGVTFFNDRPVNTGSQQGAIDACNAHYGSNVCANACGSSCTSVTRNGACSCSEPFVWHYGTGGCFGGGGPGAVSGSGCGSNVGNWN